MEKYAILALVLIFIVVYYFDNQSDNQVTALKQTSTFEIDQNKLNKRALKKRNRRSLLDTIILHNKSKNYYKDKGIRPPIIKNSADSDRGQCSKKPLFTEKIITKFAGYVLEYPCTVRSSGTIRTYFDEQDSSYSLYELYLVVVFNDDGSVWQLEHNKNESNKPAFRIILNSNGRKIDRTPLIRQRGQMTKVHEGDINGLTLYRDFGRIVGYLDGEKDASGHPPAISCGAAAETTVEDVFSLLENPNLLGTYCLAGWALTTDIYLSMPPMAIKSKDAYHFKDIYRIINSGIRDSIILTPLPQY